MSKAETTGRSPSRPLALENGENMHSREFLRRYEAMPQLKKAELIVEVASSSAAIDMRDKRRAYCRNRVQEYLVWLVAEGRLEWFNLEDDEYRPQLPDAYGLLHSRTFPGLRLPVRALLAGDTAKVLDALTRSDAER